MCNISGECRRSLHVAILTIVALVFNALGCTRHAVDKTTNSNKLQKTNAFAPFKSIESIRITCNFNNGVAECRIPKSQHAHFKSIFEYGVPVPNDMKRVAVADVEFVADGEKHIWAVIDLGEDECGLLITPTPHNLWGGIKTSEFVQFVKDCLEYRSMPRDH